MNNKLVGVERWIVIMMLALILEVLLLGSLQSRLGNALLVCALVLSGAVNLQFLVYFQKRRDFDNAPWCGMLILIYLIIGLPIAAASEPAAEWLAKFFFTGSMWVNIQMILYEVRQHRLEGWK